jgi:hypothetical protein
MAIIATALRISTSTCRGFWFDGTSLMHHYRPNRI